MLGTEADLDQAPAGGTRCYADRAVEWRYRESCVSTEASTVHTFEQGAVPGVTVRQEVRTGAVTSATMDQEHSELGVLVASSLGLEAWMIWYPTGPPYRESISIFEMEVQDGSCGEKRLGKFISAIPKRLCHYGCRYPCMPNHIRT